MHTAGLRNLTVAARLLHPQQLELMHVAHNPGPVGVAPRIQERSTRVGLCHSRLPLHCSRHPKSTRQLCLRLCSPTQIVASAAAAAAAEAADGVEESAAVVLAGS